MTKRIGPELIVKASCFGCQHEETKSYRVQGDNGTDVYCSHPMAGEAAPSTPGRHVADTRWDTPDWCPLLGIAKKVLVDKITKGDV